MLAARITVVQVLDAFQVSAAITEFSPGRDPEQFASESRTYFLDDLSTKEDALSTVIRLIRLWSEETISE